MNSLRMLAVGFLRALFTVAVMGTLASVNLAGGARAAEQPDPALDVPSMLVSTSQVVPAPADYDGDGSVDLALKGFNGVWYIDYRANGFGAHSDWECPYTEANG